MKIALIHMLALLVAVFSLHGVSGKHMQCFNYDFYPKPTGAKTACFVSDPSTWVNDKQTHCFARNTGVQQIKFWGNMTKEPHPWAASHFFPSFPWVKMTQENVDKPYPNPNTNSYTNKFKCQGTARVGCENQDLNPDIFDWDNRNTPGTNPSLTQDDKDSTTFVDFPVPTMTDFTCEEALFDTYSLKSWRTNTFVQGWITNANNPTSTWTQDYQDGSFVNLECFCQFNSAACGFSYYGHGRNTPGLQVLSDTINNVLEVVNVQTDTTYGYENSYIEVKTTTTLHKVMNITVFTKMGFGWSFLVEIVVCGGETVACTINPCDTVLYQHPGSEATPKTFTAAADFRSWFTVTVPTTPPNNYGWLNTDTPPPKGYSCCTGTLTVSLTDNCNTGNTNQGQGVGGGFTIQYMAPHTEIYLDTVPESDGYKTLYIKRDKGFPRKTFYYSVTTAGGNSACRFFDVEVCGHEGLTNAYNYGARTYGWYDLARFGVPANVIPDAGIGSMGSFFQLTGSTYCWIDYFEVVKDDTSDPTGYSATTDLAYLSNTVGGKGTNSSNLYVRKDIATPKAQWLTGSKRYIRACTIGKICRVWPFYIKVCGEETVSTTMPQTVPPGPYYMYLYAASNTGTAGVFQTRDSFNDFNTDNTQACEIFQWNIQIKDISGNFQNYSAYQDSVQDTYATGQALHRVNTLNTPNPNGPMVYPELWFTAWTRAGKTARYPFKLKVCGYEKLNYNSSLTPGMTSPDHYFVFDKYLPLQTVNVDIYRTSNDSECPIKDWTLYEKDSGGNYVPYVNDLNSIYLVNPYSIKVNPNFSFAKQLYVKTQTVTDHSTLDIEVFDPVYIKVCGNEDITTIKPSVNEFRYWNTGDHIETTNLISYFNNNDTNDCPIVYYEVHEERWDYHPENITWIDQAGTKSLIMSTRKNIKRTYQIRAMTKARQWAVLYVQWHVCGQELVDVKKEFHLVVQDQGANGGLITDFMSNLVESTDASICPITNYQLFTKDEKGNFIPYTGNLAKVDNVNHKLEINTKDHGKVKVWAKTITLGNVIGYVPIEIEICGGEEITVKPGGRLSLDIVYKQFTGLNFIHNIRKQDYMRDLQVSSENCPIDHSLTEFWYFDRIESKLKKWDKDYVWLDIKSGNIYVNTTETFHQNFYIKLRTRSSKPFYYPLDIRVTKLQTYIPNRAPYFQYGGGYQLNYTVASNNDTWRFKFNVTEQFDDHNNKTFLNFSSWTFGSLRYLYDSKTQEPTLQKKETDFLTYNKNSHELLLEIPGGIPGILKYVNAIYEFRVSIMDHMGLYSEKTFKLNLTIDKEFQKEYESIRPPKILIENPKAGRITSISVFGEVTIKLNASNQFQAKDFTPEQLKQIDKSLFNIYIEPSDGWDHYRLNPVSSFVNKPIYSLNFTSWELREFNHKMIRIKLNFQDPTAVSPFPKYDKLKIHIPELPPLFDNYPDRVNQGRRLEEKKLVQEPDIIKYEWLVEKGIQKQMYDTELGRHMVWVIYEVRWALVSLIIFAIMFGLLFRTPLDREYLMILELQLMCNFAIFHVCLPGNVEISSSIMKTFVSFNFFKDITYEVMGKETSQISGEQPLEFLGQRATYNYDSFNTMFNMETLGIILVLYLFKIFIIWVLYFYNMCTKNEKHRKIAQHYHKQWLDQAIYDDLLNIFIRAFLEFGIAIMVMFQAPSWNADVTGANIIITIVIICCMIFGIPYIYYLLYKETMINNTKNLNFKERFGMNLLGAKIDLGSYKKRQYFFWHIIIFLIVRIVFLLIAFWSTIGWVQIVLLLYLFLWNSCRIIKMRPMYGRWNNFLAVFNQLSLLVCVYHLICFSDWLDREIEYICGFSFLYWVAIFIIVNQLYILFDLLRYLYYLFQYFFPNCYMYLRMLCQLCKNWFKKIWYFFLGYMKWIWATIVYYLTYYFSWFMNWIKSINCFKPKLARSPEVDADIGPPPSVPRPIMEKIESDDEVAEHIPPPKPPEPTIKKLQLVNGVWTQVFVKMSQQQKVDGRDFLSKEAPTFNKVINTLKAQNYKVDAPPVKQTPRFSVNKDTIGEQDSQQKFVIEKETISNSPAKFEQTKAALNMVPKVKKKKKVPKASSPGRRRWTKLISDIQLNDAHPAMIQEAQPAMFHDPALFYRDNDKDRSKDAMNQKGDKILEKNPLLQDKNIYKHVYDDVASKNKKPVIIVEDTEMSFRDNQKPRKSKKKTQILQ